MQSTPGRHHPRQGSPTFPLHASTSGRYLVDAHNVPFFVTGDSIWAAPYNLSTANTQAVISTAKKQGFNTVLYTVLDNTYGNGRNDYTTYDGISPFTRTLDLSTPNPVYFARLDKAVQLATAAHMLVLMLPIDAGGSMPLLRANGLAKARSFGLFLGKRYRSYPNVSWVSGVDFETWTSRSDDQLQQAIARGISTVMPGALQTVELNYPISASRDDPTWIPPLNLDWAYNQAPQYNLDYTEYNRRTAMPFFLGEGIYDGSTNTAFDPGTPLVLRKQAWWSALTGATGEMFGNAIVWGFAAGWQNALSTTATSQFLIMATFMAAHPWWALVPDQQHTVVTGGYGTYNPTLKTIATNTYVTTARTPDGKLALSYLPSPHTITVDMTMMHGSTTARWLDPTNGTYHSIAGSPFKNAGSQRFTSPGTNGAGDPDWVLVLTSS